MAKTFSVNQVLGANPVASAFFQLKALLKAAGHTVPRSSDGSFYNSAGDLITLNATGAGGIQNANAWFCIRDPAGHEWCFQGSSAAWTTATVKFSHSAGFTGGSPTAIVLPTASDETVLGAGTTLFGSILTATSIGQFMADNAAPYAWYMIGYPTTSRPGLFLAFDPLAANTYQASDTHPYVAWVHGASTAISMDRSNLSYDQPTSWMHLAYIKDLVTGVYTPTSVGMECYTNGPSVAILFPDGNVVSPYDGFDPTRPVFYSRQKLSSIPNGEKGQSGMFKWGGVAAHGHLSTFTIASAFDYVRMGDLLVPWDGASTPST